MPTVIYSLEDIHAHTNTHTPTPTHAHTHTSHTKLIARLKPAGWNLPSLKIQIYIHCYVFLSDESLLIWLYKNENCLIKIVPICEEIEELIYTDP